MAEEQCPLYWVPKAFLGSAMSRFIVEILWMPIATCLVASVAVAGEVDDDPAVLDSIDARGLEFFETRIRPILIENCLECHGDDLDELKGGLDLSSAAGLHRGGESGKVVVPGDAEASPLFQAVTYGAATLPKTITTYKESEGASDRVKVTSPSDEFSVLSKAQATTASILGVGKYVSLGFCKTTLDWIRLAVFVAVVTGTIALRKSFVTISEVQDARRRKRARKALGVEEIMKDS